MWRSFLEHGWPRWAHGRCQARPPTREADRPRNREVGQGGPRWQHQARVTTAATAASFHKARSAKSRVLSRHPRHLDHHRSASAKVAADRHRQKSRRSRWDIMSTRETGVLVHVGVGPALSGQVKLPDGDTVETKRAAQRLFGNQHAIAQRSSPELVSNRATAPGKRRKAFWQSGADRETRYTLERAGRATPVSRCRPMIRHHPPANSDSRSTG
jgi:hypothetical protein